VRPPLARSDAATVGHRYRGAVTDEPAAGLSISSARDDATTVLEVRGELDFATAGALRAELLDASRDDAPTVALDLSGVGFIDSTGVSLLVQAKRRLDDAGRTLVLRSPSERVRRVLDLSGLGDEFALD
jgi:anti-sigma B factor antagonist